MTSPAVVRRRPPAPGKTYTRKQRNEQLRSQLDLDRGSFLPLWRDCADYVLPRRIRLVTSDVNKGDRRNLKIFDSTATFAARTLASGMMSGITSPARPWFRLTLPDPDLAEHQGAKLWLADVTDRMGTVFLRSNVYNALPVLYGDLGTFGTAAMLVQEDDETVIRCYPFPIGSYMLGNDRKYRVRVFIRDFQMTVRQIVETFPWERISPQTRDLWVNAGGTEQRIDVCHVIQPNPDHNPRALDAKFKAFNSCYYERGQQDETYLEESGYDEFPVLAPRWEVTGEDTYATSCPGMVALGDIKQLQQVEKRALNAIEKQVNPPMVAQVSMRNSKLSILPGDTSYVVDPEGKGFRSAHEVALRLDFLEAKQQQTRGRIQRAFFEDLFLMLAYTDTTRGTQPVTAREIQERHEEKLLALGPVLEQLNQDLLDPLINRTFNVMDRQGLIPPPPPELEGQTLKVEYISVMAQAQKIVGLGALDRFAGFVGSAFEFAPSVLDKVDVDEMVDQYADATGVPPQIVVPDEQVAQARQSRAEQAKAQQSMALLEQGSKAAKNLGTTPVEGSNALTALLGGGVPGGVPV